MISGDHSCVCLNGLAAASFPRLLRVWKNWSLAHVRVEQVSSMSREERIGHGGGQKMEDLMSFNLAPSFQFPYSSWCVRGTSGY